MPHSQKASRPRTGSRDTRIRINMMVLDDLEVVADLLPSEEPHDDGNPAQGTNDYAQAGQVV